MIAFSKKTDLNFDCLRAIAFELNMGSSFKEAISILNIVNVETPKYDVYLYFTNGQRLSRSGIGLDLFSTDERWISFNHNSYYDLFDVEVDLSKNMYSYEHGGCIINAKDFANFEIDEDYLISNREEVQADMEKYKTWQPAYMLFRKRESQNKLHYYAV